MSEGDEQLIALRVVSVDGLIGAGKSHLLRELDTAAVRVFVEPSSRSNKMLALFYTDPARYGAAMQFFILMLRLQIMRAVYEYAAAHPGVLLVVERCFPADMVFVLANYKLGFFPLAGLIDYMRIMDDILRALPMPNAFVVLEASSDECIRRIRDLRGRKCEQGIEPWYLDALRGAYEDLRTLVEPRGARWIRMDWSLFGTAEQFLEQAEAVPAAAADVRSAIAAIGAAPPALSGSDAPATGLLARLWALFETYLAQSKTTFAEVEAFHANALRESDLAHGNAHLDL